MPPPKKNKPAKIDPVIEARIKNFYLLANRYIPDAVAPAKLVLPYVYTITWVSDHTESQSEDFAAWTDNLVLAIMLFEADKLQRAQVRAYVLEAKIIGQHKLS